MFLSVFDVFKIGVGPSSSHTMGPMVAGARFIDMLKKRRLPKPICGLRASLHGSLAFTGVGHATDRATILGLAGFLPDTYTHVAAEAALARINATHRIHPPGLPELKFSPKDDLKFDFGPNLPGHPNGLVVMATDKKDKVVVKETFYSVGGGFVMTEEELDVGCDIRETEPVPFPFKNGEEMLQMCDEAGLTIAQLKLANEIARGCPNDLEKGLSRIWKVMNACIDRGLASEGSLPGGLKVQRRAKKIFDAVKNQTISFPHDVNDWLSAYAIAVNEENAAGGQVVTAPTNGASGVVPAVIRYWLEHIPSANPSRIQEFLLTSAAIGGLVKFNASISGAEAGCQAEIGSAAAMAAAGLSAVLDGSPRQVENAAEIALEHHLGLTCDPVRGLVQVPCIERNGLGAVKAVTAASLALRGDGEHTIPLDAVIECMRQTGVDMHQKYKETSLGGLAIAVPNC
eukprot:Selendium_serpulae@DN5698_c0_g1_i7.p1